MNLKDKVAIVTGGSSGIGLAICKKLSESGAKVIIASRDSQKGEKAASEVPNSTFISTDVTKEESVKNLVEKVLEKFGKLDIVVNDAGVDTSHPDITKV